MSTDNNKCDCGHDHKQGCTCGQDHNMTEFEHDTITLTLDDGSQLMCAVLCEFDVNNKAYIALLAINEDGEQLDDHPYFYRYSEEDGDPVLDDILDDDEYDAVVDRFDEMLDEAEFEASSDGE